MNLGECGQLQEEEEEIKTEIRSLTHLSTEVEEVGNS